MKHLINKQICHIFTTSIGLTHHVCSDRSGDGSFPERPLVVLASFGHILSPHKTSGKTKNQKNIHKPSPVVVAASVSHILSPHKLAAKQKNIHKPSPQERTNIEVSNRLYMRLFRALSILCAFRVVILLKSLTTRPNTSRNVVFPRPSFFSISTALPMSARITMGEGLIFSAVTNPVS